MTEQVLFNESSVVTAGEISADITMPAFGGSLKLIGVHSSEGAPEQGRLRKFQNGNLVDRTEFFETSETGEKIVRAEYNRKIGGYDWQIAAEGAFNFVDLSARLFELENGSFGQINLDDPKVKVEEDRAEITLTHSRALTPKLDFQGSIGVERSSLTQSGNAANSRDFVRPKGFANFSYAFSEKVIGRLEFERKVGQLDFFDFISDVDIEDNN